MNIWKHLKKCLLEYRRKLKADGEDKQDKDMLEIAAPLIRLRPFAERIRIEIGYQSGTVMGFRTLGVAGRGRLRPVADAHWCRSY